MTIHNVNSVLHELELPFSCSDSIPGQGAAYPLPVTDQYLPPAGYQQQPGQYLPPAGYQQQPGQYLPPAGYQQHTGECSIRSMFTISRVPAAHRCVCCTRPIHVFITSRIPATTRSIFTSSRITATARSIFTTSTTQVTAAPGQYLPPEGYQHHTGVYAVPGQYLPPVGYQQHSVYAVLGKYLPPLGYQQYKGVCSTRYIYFQWGTSNTKMSMQHQVSIYHWWGTSNIQVGMQYQVSIYHQQGTSNTHMQHQVSIYHQQGTSNTKEYVAPGQYLPPAGYQQHKDMLLI